MSKSTSTLVQGCSRQLLLIVILMWLASQCGAQTLPPEPAATELQNYAEVMRLVSLPVDALPENVRLVEPIRTAPIVPITRNPHVVVDPERIGPVAAFFGMRQKSDLQLVQAAVVAIYQEETPANEIGIYGLYFSEPKAAGTRFSALTKEKTHSPYLLKGSLLLYIWKDERVSKSSFEAIRNHLKAAPFKPDHRAQAKPILPCKLSSRTAAPLQFRW